MGARSSLPAVAFVLMAVAGCSSGFVGADGPGRVVQSEIGPVYVDDFGMTMYTYAVDPEGKSECNYVCAQVWPPVKADKDAESVGLFTIIERFNGSRQWTFRGKPLYTYFKDSKMGDVKGQGVDDVWMAAQP